MWTFLELVSFTSSDAFHQRNSNWKIRSLKDDSFNVLEFCSLQRSILNNLGYFGVSTSRIVKYEVGDSTLSQSWSYKFKSNTPVGKLLYWILSINSIVKVIFLALLILGLFGEIEFLDFIAAVDYVLCFLLVLLAASIWHRRYPFYEIVEASWKCLNSIYIRLGSPQELRSSVDSQQKFILINHSVIIWVGCCCLLIQYAADPKYRTFTYSVFEKDTKLFRFLFGVHEFLFMNVAWNTYAGSCSLCIFQSIALSSVINKMRVALESLSKEKSRISSVNPQYNIDKLLWDYRQLTIICNQFNDWVATKTLIMHICGGCQFVSDVFAATHVLKLPGTGFMDVWFYIEDCFAAGFMLLRTYVFMALVSTSSEQFLQTLKESVVFKSRKRFEMRKVMKSLKVISLNVGPCSITPMSVLTVLNTMGNYYVCAALW